MSQTSDPRIYRSRRTTAEPNEGDSHDHNGHHRRRTRNWRCSRRSLCREGFRIALIARSPSRLEQVRADLQDRGATAATYQADVRDGASVRSALAIAAGELGPIEVIQYSPIPQPEFLRPMLETTVEDVAAAIEFSVIGPMIAVGHALTGMRSLGRGTILLVNGGSGARPNPRVGANSIAFAAASAYGTMMHDVLAAENIHVGQLIVPQAITQGHPTYDPETLAATLWRMHAHRGAFRVVLEPTEPTG